MKLGLPAIDPYPIKFLYNVSQIMLCAYMTIEAGFLAYRHNYTILQPCNAYNKENPPIASLLWLFYISKVWDFWDTIFIVLNKKWNQLSFLHVYHHTTIFLFYWLNSHVNYDGDIYLTIVLNGFIHTVMYTYYCKHFLNFFFFGDDILTIFVFVYFWQLFVCIPKFQKLVNRYQFGGNHP
jgi:GNS1/SUR4 family